MNNYKEIRNRYFNLCQEANKEDVVEELSVVYEMSKFEIECVVNNIIDYDPDYEDSDYDSREDKCLICGANLNDGRPLECFGECSEYEISLEEREGGDPEELNFD